jgi:hypothetical protein
VNTLTVLLPPLERIRAMGMPATLARWLVRGNRLPDAVGGRDVALRECFEFVGTTLPVAALTRSLEITDAGSALWVRADPSYVTADGVTARMLACGTVDLSADESEQLARSLRPLFGDAGFPLETASAARWYLRCPVDARLPRFATPAQALGDDLMRQLPQGENERQWRHLLNEAQVILHNHPVNQLRLSRGHLPGNSVWFWGAGKLPDWVRAAFDHVRSSDDVVIALARRASIPLLASPALELPPSGNVLVDLADVDQAQALADAIAPLATALKRSGSVLQLLTEDGRRVCVRRSHLWRFWRRVPSAAAA